MLKAKLIREPIGAERRSLSVKNGAKENHRRQTRFYFQLLFLGPFVLLWLYSISNTFVLTP